MKHRSHYQSLVALAIVALFGFGCRAQTVTSCGEDGTYAEDDLGAYCAYAVIAGGFSCPATLPLRLDVGLPSGGFGVVCTNRTSTGEESFSLPPDACRAIGAAPSCSGRVAPSSNPVVEECVAAARRFRDHCAEANGANDVRVCMWEGYMALCRTGNTQLLIDSMECLEPTLCRTFSDPNDGLECLHSLHAAGQPTVAREFLSSSCSRCGGTGCDMVRGDPEIIPYLPVEDFAAVSSCGNTCSIDEWVTECASASPRVALFSQCAEP